MFRKTGSTAERGRAPSPGHHSNSHVQSPPSVKPSPNVMATHEKLPLAGGNATRRVVAAAKTKIKQGTPAKGNTSILSFFKRTDSSPSHDASSFGRQDTLVATSIAVEDDDDSLFVRDPAVSVSRSASAEAEAEETQIPTPPRDDVPEASRYNEKEGPFKRRKLGGKLFGRSLNRAISPAASPEADPDLIVLEDIHDEASLDRPPVVVDETNRADDLDKEIKVEETTAVIGDPAMEPPTLSRQSTSAFYGNIEDEFEDYIDDDALMEMGEEFLERRFAEEQQRLERDTDNGIDEIEDMKEEFDDARESCTLDAGAPPCPVCSIELVGITPEQASTHVNNCLDGRPTPLPQPAKESPAIKSEPSVPHKRFNKATIARPGQDNPVMLGGPKQVSGSAFSRLMSNHAEDAAWATAAANEVASRGKPAFKRTCPFYKILPGFYTCVDAFRYGKVQGCNAYFLSHFHSDHYIGLTSTWCHGPIYCSKVTANLVKQQLRVDPRYVVPLEFEQKTEIPHTQGVFVTMISANHCPGSSLFLYEKTVGPNKLQRVLHCGDFRACPAHVQHPLLRPDVLDIATGKSRQQKLDICYLDTTYLTPKYAFPLQQEVIQACADMCISLSKDRVDESDSWERTKKERAGAGMTKFVKNRSSDHELGEDGKAIAPNPDKKARGRLLVVVGTYSIGKERICIGMAKALNSKIYAASGKQRICAALEDPELSSLLTTDPLEAQVHMQMLMEIRAETLADYLTSYKPHFSRIVGFRPSGWNYRPPNSRFTESPLVQTVLHSDNWKSKYSMHELVPQRGSTREASCFGVPYSEHSSFRELTMFCCALRIDKIIPTVNIGNAKSRERMKGWIEKWDQEKRKNGLFEVSDGATSW